MRRRRSVPGWWCGGAPRLRCRYELFVGQPPLRTNSVGALITEDLVEYLDNMSVSESFTSFLQGLLIKDPQQRLRWSDLLKHPFVMLLQKWMSCVLTQHLQEVLVEL